MILYILFGLPGTGKTFIGKIFKQDFNFYFYDGDKDLPKDMKVAINSQSVITDAMRDIFFHNLIQSIKKARKKYKKIVVAQTFIKEKYRLLLLDEIPDAKFILIQTDTDVRELRLTN